MSSSAFDPAGHGDEQSYRPEVGSPTDAGEVEQERLLLDEVLRQTQAAFDSQETDDLTELSPFLEVARRHPDSELTLEPVLVDLVQAALLEEIGQLPISSEQHESISLRVATALFEDPVCHGRLVAFWSRLLATQQ